MSRRPPKRLLAFALPLAALVTPAASARAQTTPPPATPPAPAAEVPDAAHTMTLEEALAFARTHHLRAKAGQ